MGGLTGNNSAALNLNKGPFKFKSAQDFFPSPSSSANAQAGGGTSAS